MTIQYTCPCGATFRLPDSAIGRKARCHACNAVSIVTPDQPAPGDGSIPLENGHAADKTLSNHESAEIFAPGSWLEEFARGETVAPAEETPNTYAQQHGKPGRPSPATVKDLLAPAVSRPALPDPDEDVTRVDETRDWIAGPTRSFWIDLLQSFVFFTDAGNFLTLLFLALISLAGLFIGTFGPFGFVGTFLVAGYLCTIAFAIVTETASGEDELPYLWISSVVEDLVFPVMRFVGTWIFCLIPVITVQILAWREGLSVPPRLMIGLTAFCMFFWPVVFLCVAIGGGFRGLWPHVLIRTILAAPLSYLAVWGTLLAAYGFTCLPTSDLGQQVLAKLGPRADMLTIIMISAFSSYAMVVAMRVIGLFYRHYKQRFPWVAE